MVQIRFNSQIEISSSSRVGVILGRQLILCFRALLLSLFVYVVAVNHWRMQILDHPLITVARVLEVPIQMAGKPFIRNYLADSMVPVELGLADRPKIDFLFSQSYFEADSHLIRVNETWFFDRAFNFHMVVGGLVYLLILNLGSMGLRKLRPNHSMHQTMALRATAGDFES